MKTLIDKTRLFLPVCFGSVISSVDIVFISFLQDMSSV